MVMVLRRFLVMDQGRGKRELGRGGKQGQHRQAECDETEIGRCQQSCKHDRVHEGEEVAEAARCPEPRGPLHQPSLYVLQFPLPKSIRRLNYSHSHLGARQARRQIAPRPGYG